MIKFIKDLFKPKWNSEKYDLIHIFTDKTGAKWYRFNNIAELPNVRFIAANSAMNYADMGITRELLETRLDEIEAMINEDNKTVAGALIADIKARMSFAAEEKTLLNLACALFLREGETIKAVKSVEQNEKLKILNEDAEAHDFFLQTAANYLKNLQITSGQDIAQYLKEIEKEIHQIDAIYQTLQLNSLMK